MMNLTQSETSNQMNLFEAREQPMGRRHQTVKGRLQPSWWFQQMRRAVDQAFASSHGVAPGEQLQLIPGRRFQPRS
jgi:hypothetical protein